LSFVYPGSVGKKGADDWPDTNQEGLKVVEGGAYLFNAMPGLHYWQTPNNSQNALVRGGAADQRAAVEDLYALLLHTTSTHAPQEWGAVPWSTRDFWSVHNILPDGAASAKTIELLRNMILREEGDDLVLLSAVSPHWMQPGRSLEARKAPTDFGPMTLALQCRADGWDLRLSPAFRREPKRLRLRLPWFYEITKAQADGRELQLSSGELVLSGRTKWVRATGRIKPDTPELSFLAAVERYKREYRRRYEEFLRTGLLQP
jgi:hypothetical protein